MAAEKKIRRNSNDKSCNINYPGLFGGTGKTKECTRQNRIMKPACFEVIKGGYNKNKNKTYKKHFLNIVSAVKDHRVGYRRKQYNAKNMLCSNLPY